MANYGVFEAAVSSETEVGLARQAAVDTFNAAIYDVREKLGPALFAAASVEEFRDRVAMMKNDQSLFKIIAAHTPPVTGTVRRIVGKNSILEKEFKAVLQSRRTANDNDQFVDGPSGMSGSAGVPGAPTGGSVQGIDTTNNGGKGSFAETGKFPTMVTSSGSDGVTLQPGQSYNLNSKQVSGRRHRADSYTNTNSNPGLGDFSDASSDTNRGGTQPLGPMGNFGLKGFTPNDIFGGEKPTDGPGSGKTPSSSSDTQAGGGGGSFGGTHIKLPGGLPSINLTGGFEGTVDTDKTFKPSDDELVPEDNFDGYLNSVDQGAASKVDRNFTSALLYRDWCQANGLSFGRLSSLDAYADRLSDAEYFRLASQIQAWERQAGYPATSPGAKLLKEKTKNSPEVWNEDEGWTDHKPKTPKGQSKDKLKDVTAAKKCTGCGKPIDPLEEFPGGKCLDCHAGDPAVKHRNDNMTAEELANMWGADVLRKHKSSRDPMRTYIAWCERDKLQRISARNINIFAKGEPRLVMHLAQRMRNAVRTAMQRQAMDPAEQYFYDDTPNASYPQHKQLLPRDEDGGVIWPKSDEEWCQHYQNLDKEYGTDPDEQPLGHNWRCPIHGRKHHGSRRRTAAPDYLQKADDALTQLLNQKAQEFQETIAPLQQALVTVQQAEQLQQQQNPMNVLPPPGTVNVLPNQAAPGQVGQPDPSGGMDPNAAAAAALAAPPGQAGLGAAPGGGVPTDEAGPPPAAADQGALPPELMQATARRSRLGKGKGAARPRTAASVFELWNRWKSNPTNDQRGGEPDYEAFAKAFGVGQKALNKLRQQHAGSRAVNRYLAWCEANGRRAGHKDNLNAYAAKVGPAERKRLASVLRRIATDDDPYSGGFQQNSDPSQRPPSNSVGKGGTPPPVETPPPNPMPNIIPPGPAQVSPWPVYGAPGETSPSDIPGMIGLPTVPGMGFQQHGAAKPVNHAEEAAKAQWRKMDSSLSAKGYKYDKASGHWTKPGARPVKNHWPIKASWSRLANYLNARQHRADAGDLLKAEGDEISTIGEYTEFAENARQQGDEAAANTFEDIIGDEREHVQRFDDQLDRVAHRKQSWTGWGPSVAPKTRQVDGWEWNERLAGYTSGVPQRFSCHCGSLFDAPSGYHKCGCGKTWNSYVIGQGGPSHTASADLYIVREIPVRPGVIVASYDGSLDAGTEVSELSGVELRTGERAAREDPSPSRGQERVSLRLSERREAGNGSSLPHSRSRSADVPGIAERGGGDSPSQRQSARQPARESGLRDQGRQHAGHGAARHTVAAGQDSLPIRSPAGSTESGATPTEVGLAFLSGVRAGTQASGEAPRVGFSDRGESVLPTDHDYIASIYKLTDPGELDDEGEDDGRPTMKATPADWHRRDKNQRWTKAGRRG